MKTNETVRCLRGIDFERLSYSETIRLMDYFRDAFKQAMIEYDYCLVSHRNMAEVLSRASVDGLLPVISVEEVLLNNFLCDCWRGAEDELYDEIYGDDEDDDDYCFDDLEG